MSKIKVVIIGTGGFGREVQMTLNHMKSDYNFLGYLDENIKKDTMINNVSVLGTLDWLDHNKQTKIIIAIADPQTRKKLAQKIINKCISQNIIHPTSIISETSKLQNGVIIQSNCLITTNSKIGNFVHINYHSAIAHDCNIGDFVTISPNVHINGDVTIGDGTFIGSGVTTIQGVKIGKNCVIGAGSVVITDVPDNSMYVGVPAKFKKKIKSNI